MLTDAEKAWLNAYHADVRAALAPSLANDAQASTWLSQATKPV
jgi:Xaa-Pro aminopeptidase